MSSLAEIFARHGSDKSAHGYASVYAMLERPSALLEVGVDKGASLRAWAEWWPGLDIVGLDTFQRGYPAGFAPLGNPCIVQADSRTFDARRLYSPEKPFPSLIVDDGSHRPRDQAATLANLWPLLAPGGRYFIEDVLPVDLLGEDHLPPWFAHPSRREHFTMAAFLELAKVAGSLAARVQRHDFREQSGKPDSVLIELRKP